MNGEPQMFDENYQIIKHAKAGDPSTSFHAAKVTLRKMSENMQTVLSIFAEVAPAGLIAEELEPLAQERGLRAGTASKRISDLADRDQLVWLGEYRPTSSGCKAKVWHKPC